jgi:hypothetical protein
MEEGEGQVLFESGRNASMSERVDERLGGLQR